MWRGAVWAGSLSGTGICNGPKACAQWNQLGSCEVNISLTCWCEMLQIRAFIVPSRSGKQIRGCQLDAHCSTLRFVFFSKDVADVKKATIRNVSLQRLSRVQLVCDRVSWILKHSSNPVGCRVKKGAASCGILIKSEFARSRLWGKYAGENDSFCKIWPNRSKVNHLIYQNTITDRSFYRVMSLMSWFWNIISYDSILMHPSKHELLLWRSRHAGWRWCAAHSVSSTCLNDVIINH